MSLCVDASLIIAFLTPEPASDKAAAWMDAHSGSELIAPALIAAEVASALRKKVRRKSIGSQFGQEALDAFGTMNIRLVWDQSLIARAFELASELDRPSIYDSLYLALAEREQCDFWTADARFAHAAAFRYPFVRLLD